MLGPSAELAETSTSKSKSVALLKATALDAGALFATAISARSASKGRAALAKAGTTASATGAGEELRKASWSGFTLSAEATLGSCVTAWVKGMGPTVAAGAAATELALDKAFAAEAKGAAIATATGSGDERETA